ncbi:thylakoid lumenal 15 kDa protein 1, chloroplastic isoform X2 [Ananas comosus]|uniref:Thylakoid lumenal 15 kDa protein 1, chloroplastic isoform X2 n=1 Tax=Ananas comosus TaxID=4615 RepID=A0A6P5GDY9_ANACO|nr:thylakoid lumenal 15 kDa protein 1, chloroplastic isoform X2 [Ananas comosus]
MASLTISTSCGLLLLRPKLNRPSSPPLSSATKCRRRCSSPRGAFDLTLAPEKTATPSCSISWSLSAVEGSLGQGAAAAAALLAASLFLADPALAFKGGGPYGAEVTRGQDLTGKDFSGKTLIKQDFKTSILRQANFKGAKLVGASFFDADLTGADLSDADLRGADFSLANVTKANLQNANLEGALTTGNTSFKGSNIYGADFTDVPLREDQREYLCRVADGVNPTTGNATRDTLLCS